MTDAPVTTDPNWIFLKIYLGEAVDRMDWMIAEVARLSARRDDLRKWFFLRYIDKDGIHVRLRVLPTDEASADTIRADLIDATADRLSRIHAQPPGDYAPMVSLPGFEEQIEQVTAAHNDVRVVEAAYEPEHDKFGGAAGMPIAETLFFRSSEIAARLIELDADGALSRKSLIPRLMHETFEAFRPGTDPATFWREYSYYWLGARTPAAEDWRDRFAEKAADLADDGISPLAPLGAAQGEFDALVSDWRTALDAAAADYAALGGQAGINAEVLAFTFAHLMNNRLGIASLEEAYMAALVEQAAEPGKEAA
ncbi:hypothetical protein OCH239_15135 [Roseivivax halodurans JCM 10272]|uniref:Thiopeptide-type bacteriocin biosynthesis domain-containing protein n=1 Tax=Roseivivax halodurans JCM 10272 TaxID=1449350 RepID=X7EAS7_9RHOB|nr:thiopeptide-type bacteriocin biosynthesis protein [Roseivivax halodurans]ETX12950.1 hypothetical protein OCH239_15135 [Roseivivax halodurans JCM 10272]